MIRRPLTMLCLALGACAMLAAQGTGARPVPPAQDPQQPAFRTRIDAISVDATVTDRQGRPVTDLRSEDFEIRESGKVQTIDSFRFVQIDDSNVRGAEPLPQILSQSQMDRETANPENRLFIIFLDEYHTRQGNAQYIRQSLAKWVQTLTPHDLVALLYPLTPIAAVTFSRDHDGTAAAIMQFEGRKYNYKTKYRYEEYFADQPPEVQESIRNDLVIRTMQSACALMATLRDGRKTILFVSEGMAANIPAGARTSSSLFPPRTVAAPNPSQAQESYEFFRSSDLQLRMRPIFSVAARGNTAIYTLDPRGLAPSEFGAGDFVDPQADQRILNEAIDSLRIIADETDGRAIVGRNDPLPDLKRMVQSLSSYYLLGYTSSLAPRDGRFHEIDVRVNRKDVEVHARKGYWAYSEEELKRASEPPKAGPPEEVATALDTLAAVVEPTSRRNVVLWLGAVRGDAERAQVTVVWETPPGLGTLPEDRVEQVTLTASSGSEVLFRGAVPRDPNALRPSGRVTFAAPAGPIRIRIVSENARGQKLDTEDVTDLVPDFSGPRAAITAPLVFRARTARDVAAIQSTPTAMPSATRQFSRTERLLLRFDAYGPGGVTPEVSLRLLNRAGGPLAALPAPTAVADKPGTFEVDLGLASLPQGDYLIEITAVTPTDKTVRLLGIRVTG